MMLRTGGERGGALVVSISSALLLSIISAGS